MKKMKTATIFPEVKHGHNNPATSFGCARVTKSIIYVAMPKQKAPISMLSRSKTQQIAVTDMREKPVDFFNGTARIGIDFSSRNSFDIFGSLAKVYVPAQCTQWQKKRLWHLRWNNC